MYEESLLVKSVVDVGVVPAAEDDAQRPKLPIAAGTRFANAKEKGRHQHSMLLLFAPTRSIWTHNRN